MLDGVELKPALALGSWLAFRSEGDQALVMGDLVLTESRARQDRSRARLTRVAACKIAVLLAFANLS
jgi:hypothetical protein